MNKRRLKKSIFSRITLIVVLCLFVLLMITMIATLAFTSLIANYWAVDEDNIFLFGTIIMAFSIVFGVALSFAYSAIIVRASRPYLDAMQKVAEGDFSVRITDPLVFSNFNIAKNFNYMTGQLQSVETLRENFVSDFSHEFKTPISSISGFAKLLKNPNLTAEERNEYLDVIIDESRRLVELSESVLMLNKLDSTDEVTKEEYSLDEQLRQCVLMFQQQCEDKGLELNVELESVTVRSNYKLLSQVFVNLLNNAVKFTEQGHIDVFCRNVGLNVLVEISDTGCGMDEETRSNIFTKFYQGDKSHTTPGNGLGLSIVKKIVDLLGGQIFVESKPGEGSKFSVLLLKGV